jgi:hypothetical protein
MGVRVAGQEFSGRELARTAAVMRLTAQQLRRTAARVHASAAAARSQGTAARLRAMGDAVLVQAEAIMQRAGRLAPAVENDAQTPPAWHRRRTTPALTGRGRVVIVSPGLYVRPGVTPGCGYRGWRDWLWCRASSSWSSRMMIRTADPMSVPWSHISRARAARRIW